jgi:hypothetical protein
MMIDQAMLDRLERCKAVDVPTEHACPDDECGRASKLCRRDEMDAVYVCPIHGEFSADILRPDMTTWPMNTAPLSRPATRAQKDRLLAILGHVTTPAEHLGTALAALERLGQATRADEVVTRQDCEDIGTATGHVFIALNALKALP